VTAENSLSWRCNGCGKIEIQGPPRSMVMPPIPPRSWIRVQISRFREIPGTKDHKKSEELQTTQHDFCGLCAGNIENWC